MDKRNKAISQRYQFAWKGAREYGRFLNKIYIPKKLVHETTEISTLFYSIREMKSEI